MKRRKPSRYKLSDGKTYVTGSKLRRSNREMKLDAMRTWFYANYADPVESTPYDSREGGYIYIWGGPYEPEEELQAEFNGVVPDNLIEELSAELCDISWEWTKHPDYGEDDYLFESMAASADHQNSFNEALASIRDLLAIKVQGAKKSYLLRLLYINVVTALETYLSDVFISYVDSNRVFLRKFIETTPEFKAEKVALSELFMAMDNIEKKARTHLVDIVWHHLHKVKPMYKATLGIDFPKDISSLFTAVAIRHDLVHRNGKTKDGNIHSISTDDVKQLAVHAQEFVSFIDTQVRVLSEVQDDDSLFSTVEIDF